MDESLQDDSLTDSQKAFAKSYKCFLQKCKDSDFKDITQEEITDIRNLVYSSALQEGKEKQYKELEVDKLFELIKKDSTAKEELEGFDIGINIFKGIIKELSDKSTDKNEKKLLGVLKDF